MTSRTPKEIIEVQDWLDSISKGADTRSRPLVGRLNRIELEGESWLFGTDGFLLVGIKDGYYGEFPSGWVLDKSSAKDYLMVKEVFGEKIAWSKCVFYAEVIKWLSQDRESALVCPKCYRSITCADCGSKSEYLTQFLRVQSVPFSIDKLLGPLKRLPTCMRSGYVDIGQSKIGNSIRLDGSRWKIFLMGVADGFNSCLEGDSLETFFEGEYGWI